MCSALKISVCVATVLAISVASNERRSSYDTNPWQSPTSWEFRTNNNYNNIPTTKISRVNNYNPYPNAQRNQGRNSGREQSSGWIPISPNSQQNYGARYGQNVPQRPRINAYNTIRYSAPVDVEELLSGRTGQRRPNYSVQTTRLNQVSQQTLRNINGKLLVQPVQNQVYRNLNQAPRNLGYQRQPIGSLNNGGAVNLHSERASPLPLAIEGRFLGVKVQPEDQGNTLREANQPIGEPIQLTLEDLIRANEIKGRLLGVNVQQETSVDQTNDAPNLRVINSAHLIRDGQILGGNLQRPSGYAVKETPEPEGLNQQDLRVVNNGYLVDSGVQDGQNNYQPDVQLKQILRVITPASLIRPSEPQVPREQYLINDIQQNYPSVNYGQGSGESNPQTLALINQIRANQLQAEQEQLLRNHAQQVVNSNSDQLIGSNQSPAEEWRQEIRNNEGSNVDASNLEANADQTQQPGVENGANQQPNVYTYAELTAKIWKVLKSNPEMMSNIENLRQLLLDDRNSRNEQIRELKSLLQEARKYNRNGVIYGRNQTPEQQERNKFLGELMETMDRDEESANLPEFRRQLPYQVDNQRQGRYVVRPADVNPLIKNLLFTTSGRNQTQAQNTPSVRPTPIIVRPSNSRPLPQLEVAEPFGLEQLDHHYDLTQWKQITESLKGNPFLQQYNIFDHLV